MKFDKAENVGDKFLNRDFYLPFCNHSIRMDEIGVKHIACLACKMAQKYASPVEADTSYAQQMSVFIIGYVASYLDSDAEKLQLFSSLIPEVSGWLNRICGGCEEPPDFELLGEICNYLK